MTRLELLSLQHDIFILKNRKMETDILTLFQEFIGDMDDQCKAGVCRKERLVYGDYFESQFGIIYSQILRFKSVIQKRYFIRVRRGTTALLHDHQVTLHVATTDICRMFKMAPPGKPVIILIEDDSHFMVLVIRRNANGELEAVMKDCQPTPDILVPFVVCELLKTLNMPKLELVGHLFGDRVVANHKNSLLEAIVAAKGIMTATTDLWSFDFAITYIH